MDFKNIQHDYFIYFLNKRIICFLKILIITQILKIEIGVNMIMTYIIALEA